MTALAVGVYGARGGVSVATKYFVSYEKGERALGPLPFSSRRSPLARTGGVGAGEFDATKELSVMCVCRPCPCPCRQESRLGRPPLVRETSRWAFTVRPALTKTSASRTLRSRDARRVLAAATVFRLQRSALNPLRFLWSRRRESLVGEGGPPLVLEPELAERLEWTRNSILSAKKNQTPFRHLLLHGPPGTGKTLFART